MKKKAVLFLCLAFSVGIMGCGTKEENQTTNQNAENVEKNTQALEEDTSQEEEQNARALTNAEIAFFTEYIQEFENYGFLLSVYDSADKVNLDEVLYSGAGISGAATTEQLQEYFDISNQEEVHTNLLVLEGEQINSYLLEKTGFELKDMKNPLQWWTYSEKLDTYYLDAGDTNYELFQCVGGTVADDVYTVQFCPSNPWDGFHTDWREAVLKKDGENYQFVSNRIMTEKDLIEDQSFEVTHEELGTILFASYGLEDAENEPKQDVTFKIIQNGVVKQQLYGPYGDNYRKEDTFENVKAVSFRDINSDGKQDIIIIVSYRKDDITNDEAIYDEVRLYEYSEYGSFVLNMELSENTQAALADITVESILGFLGIGDAESVGTRATTAENWQEAYIQYIEQTDNESYDGYTLIYLDNDDVPELVRVGMDNATGTTIIHYYNGNVFETQLRRLGFSYIERSGRLCNGEGNMDCYTDVVYELNNGEMNVIGMGEYGAEDNSNVQFDKDGNPIYQYIWEGKKMSEEDYLKNLNQIYDTSKAIFGYDWENLYEAEELIAQLKK